MPKIELSPAIDTQNQLGPTINVELEIYVNDTQPSENLVVEFVYVKK